MVCLRLAAAQAGLGHDVHILTYASPDARSHIESLIEQLPCGDQIVRHELDPQDHFERFFGRRAAVACRALVRDVDVLHAHMVWQRIIAVSTDEAKRAGVPYVIRACGVLDPWCLSQKALKKRIALALRYKRMLDDALYLHVLNIDERDLIKPLGLKCPMEVIPNGVFVEEFEQLPPPGTFIADHDELQGRPFILFMSRLHYKKGLDHLADAFAIFARANDEAHLVVAGPDEGAREDFERRIAAAEIADRVHLVGPVYGEAKLAALRDASCFCLPSRQEGFSMAITEALACGVPAVISRDCHFPEVAEAGAGAVVDLDAQRVADALLRVMDDEPLRRRMGDAGRELVRSRFTWPHIAEQTINAYDRWSAYASRAAS
jgi:glycosyltransferase involved in cell wall biosynthesis